MQLGDVNFGEGTSQGARVVLHQRDEGGRVRIHVSRGLFCDGFWYGGTHCTLDGGIA